MQSCHVLLRQKGLLAIVRTGDRTPISPATVQHANPSATVATSYLSLVLIQLTVLDIGVEVMMSFCHRTQTEAFRVA